MTNPKNNEAHKVIDKLDRSLHKRQNSRSPRKHQKHLEGGKKTEATRKTQRISRAHKKTKQRWKCVPK